LRGGQVAAFGPRDEVLATLAKTRESARASVFSNSPGMEAA